MSTAKDFNEYESALRTGEPLTNGNDKPRVLLRRAHEIVAEQRETKWLLHKINRSF